jgi:hypothetical protein
MSAGLRRALNEWVRDRAGRRVVSSMAIQSLWGGYGRVVRVGFEDGTTAIVKSVTPPAGSGIGHRRKLQSYRVEQAFYEASTPIDGARIAACHGVEIGDGYVWFLLEDLDAAGFRGRRHRLGPESVEYCLSWLAAFHAAHLGEDADGLWPVGTYWHLATRPDELATMADGPLKDAAPELDRRLREATHQTWVHGDAKPANFCFGPAEAAAVDFQYVGRGPGIRDVAYLLGALSGPELEANLDACLDLYFGHLRLRLGAAAGPVEAEGRALFPIAWADYARFLAGWAPGHRESAWSDRMVERALAAL